MFWWKTTKYSRWCIWEMGSGAYSTLWAEIFQQWFGSAEVQLSPLGWQYAKLGHQVSNHHSVWNPIYATLQAEAVWTNVSFILDNRLSAIQLPMLSIDLTTMCALPGMKYSMLFWCFSNMHIAFSLAHLSSLMKVEIKHQFVRWP